MGPIQSFLSHDHERLHALLARATVQPQRIDETVYSEFRAGLLRHLAMEEKVLLAGDAFRRGDDSLLRAAAQLRLDRAALAAMLGARPDPLLLIDLWGLLELHHLIEEGDGGVYAQCERLAGDDIGALLASVHAVPLARPAPYAPQALIATEIRLALDAAYRGPARG